MTDVLIHPTAPADHTMGVHLSRYVLPKVPALDLTNIRSIRVYGSRSLAMLLDAKPESPKLFNWRRPDFIDIGHHLHCVTSPGQDYTYHYAKLIATANHIRGREIPVLLDQPSAFHVRAFVERWLPKTIPTTNLVILGYVEQLFMDYGKDEVWHFDHGFGWKRIMVAGRPVLLLGCEFSYWGDIAGALVAAIARRRLAPWIVYVGKLGALAPDINPNQWLVTGSRSMLCGVEIEWRSRLANLSLDPAILKNMPHVTMGSVIDETKDWADQARQHYQVVDPEIGHMGSMARLGKIDFDFLHLVTDNLTSDFGQGLYDERSIDVRQARMSLIHKAEETLKSVIMRTC